MTQNYFFIFYSCQFKQDKNSTNCTVIPASLLAKLRVHYSSYLLLCPGKYLMYLLSCRERYLIVSTRNQQGKQYYTATLHHLASNNSLFISIETVIFLETQLLCGLKLKPRITVFWHSLSKIVQYLHDPA